MLIRLDAKCVMAGKAGRTRQQDARPSLLFTLRRRRRPPPPRASPRPPTNCRLPPSSPPSAVFEGWYFRVTLPGDGASFALIYSIEDPAGGGRCAGVGAQVMGPDDGYLLQYSPQVQTKGVVAVVSSGQCRRKCMLLACEVILGAQPITPATPPPAPTRSAGAAVLGGPQRPGPGRYVPPPRQRHQQQHAAGRPQAAAACRAV